MQGRWYRSLRLGRHDPPNVPYVGRAERLFKVNDLFEQNGDVAGINLPALKLPETMLMVEKAKTEDA